MNQCIAKNTWKTEKDIKFNVKQKKNERVAVPSVP